MAGTIHAGIVAGGKKSIDPVQLQHLEQSFRVWANAPIGRNRKVSRRRILLIFLLIRYTGARLNEILGLDPEQDIDWEHHSVRFRKHEMKKESFRDVRIPEHLVDEIQNALREFNLAGAAREFFKIDPAHVRRRFYDRAEHAGITRELGTPEAIRRSRAIELMQSNVPLPVVQKIMGHSTPNLVASYVEYSDQEIRKVEQLHIARENQRKTSARNAFFGKIETVRIGDVQSAVEIVSIDGLRIHSVVTNHSQRRLGLNPGCLVGVEVKAPWVVLYKGEEEPRCSAENRFKGTVLRIIRGRINSEVVVQVTDRTELCSILTETSRKMQGVEKGDTVWAVFNAAMAVIHIE